MSDIAEHIIHYRNRVDVEWGTLYDKIEEVGMEIARLTAENKRLSELLDRVWRCHSEWDEGAYYVVKIPNALHDQIHNVCFPPDNTV